MNKSLHMAFLATVMFATSAQARPAPAPAPAPAPGPHLLGADAGTFTFYGTGDDSFYVTLDAGKYVITGDIKITAASDKSFNLTGASATSGLVSDAFEHQGADHYFEDPYVISVVTPTTLLLSVGTNGKKNGEYAGTLTVADASVASVVPEPATTALLLAGAGPVGFVARRRRA
jgi:hypothetical protein